MTSRIWTIGRTPIVILAATLLVLTVVNPAALAAGSPDLTVAITDSPDPVTFGSNVTYTVTVTNSGDDHANSVTLTNVVTGGTLVSATEDQGPQGSCATPASCSLGTINKAGAGDSDAQVVVVVSPTAAGTPVSLTTTVATTGETDTADNSANESTTVVAAPVALPDVSITKVDNVVTATAGVDYNYTLTVSNSSVTPATNVTVTDSLDNALTLVSVTPSSGTCNNTISCSLGTVTQGSPATITIVVNPKNSAVAQSPIGNTASVTATGETATGNNSATESTTVVAAPNGGGNTGDASIVNPANGAPFSSQNNEPHVPCVPFAVEFTGFDANQALNYRAYAQNPTTPNGPSTAPQLVPATAISVNGSGTFTTGPINLESVLLNNFSRQGNQGYHLTLEVDTAAPFDYAAGGGDNKSKTFWIDCSAGKIDVVKTVTAGSDQTEEFAFSITGPNSFSDTATLGHNESTATTTPVQTFEPTDGGTYTIVETAEAGWNAPQISCTKGPSATPVTMTSTNGGQGVSFTQLTSNVTCTFTNTQAAPPPTTDVSITKADDEIADPVDEGENFVYTLTVTNIDANDSAANVTVTDNLPDDVTYVSHTVDGVADTGALCSITAGDTLACAFGSMGPGDDFVVAVTVTADKDGTLSNTASVATTSLESSTINNEDTEPTTVANVIVPPAEADVSITKTDDETTNGPFIVGDTVTYTLTATNGGPAAAQGVQIADTLPSGLTLVSAVPSDLSDSCVVVILTNSLTCTQFGPLPPAGPNNIFVVTVTATATTAGVKTNTATVSSTSPTDRVLGNNSDSEDTTIGAAPPGPSTDMSITKIDDEIADPVDEGENFVYTLTVANVDTTDAAANVTVTDNLPDDVTYVSHTIDGAADTGALCSYTAGTDTFACAFGTMAAGADYLVAVTVTADVDGTLNNTASVATTSVDGVSSNDQDSEATTVANVPGAQSADLSILLVDDEDPITLGDDVTYTATITNNGPDTACGLIVDLPNVDDFDLDLESFEIEDDEPDCGTGGQIQTTSMKVLKVVAAVQAFQVLPLPGACVGTTCNLGSLPNGGSATVSFTGTPTKTGLFSRSSSVSSTSPPDPNLANNTATQQTLVRAPGGPPTPPGTPSADVSVTKTDSTDPATIGSPYSYTLTVANAGPDTAQAVTVSDTLPTGLTFVSATSATPGVTCSFAGATVSCQMGSLASGGQAQIVIVVIPTVAGLVVNTATASSPTIDPDPSNNTDSEGTTIGAPPVGGAGSIIVEKHTVPDGAPGAFTFSGAISATLQDDGAASETVSAGRYTVRELGEKGWDLARIECFDSDANGIASSGNIAAKTATFNVEAGETVRCVFTNVKEDVLGEQIDERDDEAAPSGPSVKGSPGVLPFTGATIPLALLVLVGLMLIVVGMTSVVSIRKG